MMVKSWWPYSSSAYSIAWAQDFLMILCHQFLLLHPELEASPTHIGWVSLLTKHLTWQISGSGSEEEACVLLWVKTVS